MIHQLINIPRQDKFVLACSGGVDSMAIASFYITGKKSFDLAYFDHNTGNARGAIPVIKKFAKDNNLNLHIGTIQKAKPAKLSLEEHWRNERYAFLNSFSKPIVTCHHLNDAIETWLFTSIHGNPKLIPVKNRNILRPFLINTKDILISWCKRNNVSWYEDMSNTDIKYSRNRIRHNIVPQALEVNPGLYKVIKKKYLFA